MSGLSRCPHFRVLIRGVILLLWDTLWDITNLSVMSSIASAVVRRGRLRGNSSGVKEIE